MKVLVCVKQVPSSEARIAVAPDGVSIKTDEIEMVINPYDVYALEEALRIKEARGGEVIVASVGPEKAREAIRTCLAMGADKGVLVKDPAYLGGDGLGVARILADVIRGIEPDLVLCGKLSIDIENDGVPIAIAEYLGWPHVSLVTKIEWTGDRDGRAHREIESGREMVAFSLPAVLTAEKGLNEPRYPSLKGIMAAKRKPIDEVTPGVAAAEVGVSGAAVRVTALTPPPQRGAGKKIEGDPEQVVSQLVEWLKNEARCL